MEPHLYSGISPPQTWPGRCGGRLWHRPELPIPRAGSLGFAWLFYLENRDEIEQNVTKSTARDSEPSPCGVRPSEESFSREVPPFPASPAGPFKFLLPLQDYHRQWVAKLPVKDGSANWVPLFGLHDFLSSHEPLLFPINWRHEFCPNPVQL